MDELDIIIKELTERLNADDEEFPKGDNRLQNILNAIDMYGDTRFNEGHGCGCNDSW